MKNLLFAMTLLISFLITMLLSIPTISSSPSCLDECMTNYLKPYRNNAMSQDVAMYQCKNVRIDYAYMCLDKYYACKKRKGEGCNQHYNDFENVMSKACPNWFSENRPER